MRLFAASLVLTVAALTGCATTSGQQQDSGRVWPAPPDPPRIRHVQTLSSENDLPQKGGVFTWMADLFGGGEAPKGISKPYGVYAHGDRVFVTDTGWDRLLVFDPEVGEVHFWGQDGPVALALPLGLCGDGADGVWVADGEVKRVLRYDRDGRFVAAVGRDGELDHPVGVAFDAERDRLYVVDTKAHQIVVYEAGSGRKVTTLGQRGGGEGEFNYPTNISLGRDGLLYVTDTMNFRVQVLERDGTFVRSFGGNCNGPGCTPRAKGVGLDSEGHVYVTDAAFSMVQLFNEAGQALLDVGGPGDGPGMLFLPAGLYVSPDDRIYVADQLNRRVNVYQYLPAPSPETAEASPAE